jgi:hypothetical protein
MSPILASITRRVIVLTGDGSFYVMDLNAERNAQYSTSIYHLLYKILIIW